MDKKIPAKLKKVIDESYFILPVGNFRQGHAWTCGAAALKIVLDYYGRNLSEKFIMKLAGTNQKFGTPPMGIVKAAKRLGFKAQDLVHVSQKDVERFLKKGIPLIANYQYSPARGEGHYAVIIGFNNKNFVLSDPAFDEGYNVVPIKKFMKNWYELEDETVREGIIIEKTT